jgi:site-specific DNA recombinase
MFKAAEERLHRNRELAQRNTKRPRLLRSFIKCCRCGCNYVSHTAKSKKSKTGDRPHERSYYYCDGYGSLVHAERCKNKWYRANYLDQLVWERIEAVLANPEIVMAEVRRRQVNTEDPDSLQKTLDMINTQLANREKQRLRAWKAFELTGRHQESL